MLHHAKIHLIISIQYCFFTVRLCKAPIDNGRGKFTSLFFDSSVAFNLLIKGDSRKTV